MQCDSWCALNDLNEQVNAEREFSNPGGYLRIFLGGAVPLGPGILSLY